MKHTKGKWSVKTMHNRIFLITSETSKQTIVYDVFGETMEEAKSNATLISHAPELLEALETLMKNCSISQNATCPDGLSPYANALSVVGRAKGKKFLVFDCPINIQKL